MLVDDQDRTTVHGAVVVTRDDRWPVNLDFIVAASGSAVAGTGDRVVLSSPYAGRKVRLDGVAYRIVNESDVIAKAGGHVR